MLRRSAARLAVCVLLLAPPAGAQVTPGDVVRFGDPQGLLVRGTVVRVDSVVLAVRVTDGGGVAKFPVESIFNVEVLRGSGPMGPAAIARGAMAGMVGGVVAGSVLGGGSGEMVSRGEGAAILGVLGAAAGMLVGTAVSVIPVDDWVAVDLRHPRSDRSPGSPRWREVTVGDTVRLTIGDQLQADAIVLGAGATELVLDEIARHDTVVVTIATIRKAEVARGVQSGDELVGRAALAGAGIGAMIGAGNRTSRGLFAGLYGGVGAAIGGGAGTLLTIRPEPLWVPFNPMTMRAAPASP